jgi:hypothetical protein
MTAATDSNKFKLKNPTEYHLLATQQQQQSSSFVDGISLSHLHLQPQQDLDFNDYYNQQQQQFLSPISNSPPLQDFEDSESLTNGSSAAVIGNMMIQPPNNPYFFPSPSMLHNNNNNVDESLSDYSSSVDFFSQPSSFLMDFHHHQQYQGMTRKSSIDYNQPFSAPAHMGLNNPLLSSSSSHIGMAAFHQPPEPLVNGGPRSLEEYESIQIK